MGVITDVKNGWIENRTKSIVIGLSIESNPIYAEGNPVSSFEIDKKDFEKLRFIINCVSPKMLRER